MEDYYGTIISIDIGDGSEMEYKRIVKGQPKQLRLWSESTAEKADRKLRKEVCSRCPYFWLRVDVDAEAGLVGFFVHTRPPLPSDDPEEPALTIAEDGSVEWESDVMPCEVSPVLVYAAQRAIKQDRLRQKPDGDGKRYVVHYYLGARYYRLLPLRFCAKTDGTISPPGTCPYALEHITMSAAARAGL